jgi:hypothetical protein
MLNSFVNFRKKNIPNFIRRINKKFNNEKDRENTYKLLEKRFLSEFHITQLDKIKENYENLSKLSER